MRQQRFQAQVNNAGAGAAAPAVSEDITAYLPTISRGNNLEILIHEIIPSIKRIRTGFGWTFRTAIDRVSWCMDEDISTIYNRHRDAIPVANCNEAALKTIVQDTISSVINRDFPQDDIVEMMQTSMCKPTDVTPSEHHDRFEQLKKCADWTNGTCAVPSDQELKTYWLPSHPISMRDGIRLHGLNQDSDLAELKEALDELNIPSTITTVAIKMATEAVTRTKRPTTAIERGLVHALVIVRGPIVMIIPKGLIMAIVEDAALDLTQGAPQASTCALTLMHPVLSILA
jgi:hypothetical protein